MFGAIFFESALIVIKVISRFGFDGRTLVMITSVPGHCLSFTSDMLKGISLKTTNSFFY